MKNSETIRLFEQSLYIRYDTTGELHSVNLLRLDQGVTLTREDNAIWARYHNSPSPFLIERFASEALADAAELHLQRMVQRHLRRRRFSMACKNILLWGALPTIGFMFLLVLNLALSRVAGGVSPQSLPIVADAIAGQAIAANTPTPRPSPPDAPELARAMADGVKAGKFSIAYSRGSKGTLYVFSDPSCPSCRSLERELTKLGKDYTIHVFPVSVIGGGMSARRLQKLMCAPSDARAPMWKQVIQGGDPGGENCSDGAAAVAANDQIFRAMRFEGTPTIVNAWGDKYPDAYPNTNAAIRDWMNAHK
jgi:TrbB protein